MAAEVNAAARVPVTARRATVVPAPALGRSDIVTLRKHLGLSQPVFARALNVSPETVRAWEQGKREPDGAALRLLEVAEDHPDWLLEKVKATTGVEKPRRRVSSSR